MVLTSGLLVEWAPQMAATSICVPRVSPSFLLPLWKALQNQVDLTQAPFKLLILPWVQNMWDFVCTL